MFHLGSLYLNGWGPAKDPKEAAKWFKRAAERRNPDAMYFLGMMYDKGQGVDADADAALTWLRRAASAGSDEAKALLRSRTGSHVPSGPGEASKPLLEDGIEEKAP